MTHAVLDVAPARSRRTSADVRAALTFITPSDAKPVFYSSALTGGAPQVLFETERHTVLIQDMRPLADALALDREGFELLRHETAVSDLYDDDAIEQRLLSRDRGAAARGDRRQPRRRVRCHPALRRRRRRQEPRRAARPGEPGARRLHREERAAAGQGSARRGRGQAPCRIRRPDRPDQRLAADPRPRGALAAGARRRRERAARGPDRDRPGVPGPGRRDLSPRAPPGAALVLRAPA